MPSGTRMLRIDLTTTLPQLNRKVDLLTERSLRYATSNALRGTANAARDYLKAEIAKPSGPIKGGATRWTVGAVAADWPRPSNLEARVGFRSDRPRAAGRYLLPVIRGGMPKPKAVDLSAAKVARVGGGVVIVPTKAQRLTKEGNVSLSQYRTILGAARDRTPGSRYFLAPVAKGSTTMGVYRRMGRGRQIRALFTLTAPKRRSSTFDLGGLLHDEIRRAWPGEFTEAIGAELRRHGFR